MPSKTSYSWLRHSPWVSNKLRTSLSVRVNYYNFRRRWWYREFSKDRKLTRLNRDRDSMKGLRPAKMELTVSSNLTLICKDSQQIIRISLEVPIQFQSLIWRIRKANLQLTTRNYRIHCPWQLEDLASNSTNLTSQFHIFLPRNTYSLLNPLIKLSQTTASLHTKESERQRVAIALPTPTLSQLTWYAPNSSTSKQVWSTWKIKLKKRLMTLPELS